MKEANKGLETVQRTLNLLSLFTVDKPEWGITELAEELGLHKSVVHRMLYTLHSNSFVNQNVVTKKYRLGVKLFELGMVVNESMDLRTEARPFMEKLFKETGETVLLAIVDGLTGICIEKIESSEGLKCTSRVGKRVPLNAGYTKLLLAHMPQESTDLVINSGLIQFTKQTPTDPNILKKQIEEIRQIGYSLTYGEMDEGSVGVSVPLRDYTNTVIGTLAIVGPQFRIEPKLNQYITLCCETGDQVSRRLGWLGV